MTPLSSRLLHTHLCSLCSHKGAEMASKIRCQPDILLQKMEKKNQWWIYNCVLCITEYILEGKKFHFDERIKRTNSSNILHIWWLEDFPTDYLLFLVHFKPCFSSTFQHHYWADSHHIWLLVLVLPLHVTMPGESLLGMTEVFLKIVLTLGWLATTLSYPRVTGNYVNTSRKTQITCIPSTTLF